MSGSEPADFPIPGRLNVLLFVLALPATWALLRAASHASLPWALAAAFGFMFVAHLPFSLLHEAVHVFDPRSGEDEIHVSEWDPRFDAMPPDLLVHNPSAYASFAAQIHARALEWPREARYGAGNPAL